MRLKSFHAADMQSAMQQIRDELGDDAVIISTTRDAATKKVVVTAAIDPGDVTLSSSPAMEETSRMEESHPTAAAAHHKTDLTLQGLRDVLQHHSLPQQLTDQLLETAELVDYAPDGSHESLERLLSKVLENAFQFLPLPINRTGFKLMLVGPPGMGKTMTLAKMAAQMVMDKHALTVISIDTQRAGGIEQLRAFTDILNIELEVAETAQELKQILQNTANNHTVLIDSFGCNPYVQKEMEDLAPFLKAGEIEPVLTLTAGGDPQEASDIADSFAFAKARRLLITRCDVSRRFGSVLNAAHHGKHAFCNFSSSARVVGEYGPLGAKTLARFLLRYKDV